MSLKNILPGRLGVGTAPLGNMFRAIPDEDAHATVEAAWDQGIRYYDTAPFYGAGLAEERLGEVLSAKPRDSYVLSSKVGRVILDQIETEVPDFGEKGGLFEHGNPNKILHEWTADATERSIEGSLRRMGVDRFDIVWVHDIAQAAGACGVEADQARFRAVGADLPPRSRFGAGLRPAVHPVLARAGHPSLGQGRAASACGTRPCAGR
ncbi:aldo/keto reductase, partial [Streptomyces sp. NPDC047725]|uniref:aldo/keto reductase n=1 Tax=Streptomyces sp. NPDC047725 TaxID=3365487 RepID=UPI003720DB60